MLELHSDASSLGLHCGGDASFSARLLGLKSCAVSLPYACFCALQHEGGDTTSLGVSLLGMFSRAVFWCVSLPGC